VFLYNPNHVWYVHSTEYNFTALWELPRLEVQIKSRSNAEGRESVVLREFGEKLVDLKSKKSLTFCRIGSLGVVSGIPKALRCDLKIPEKGMSM